MKASELRIGNIVEVNGKFVTVKSIEFNPVSNEYYLRVGEQFGGIKAEFVNPITLTEEWLLKLGFIKHNNNNSMVDFIDGKTGWFTLAERDGFFCLCEYRDLIGEQFKYVHQLQNLYFALTGKELELKENGK